MQESTTREAITAWHNPLKAALKSGKVCVGLPCLSFACPAVAQIAAEAGYHYCYLDMEHSGLAIDAMAAICSAAKAVGITPIGGSSGIANFLISRLLDNGAMGVIAPHVSNRRETELVVHACRYPPLGERGFLTFAPSTDFRSSDAQEWVASMNREILAAVKVENAQGLANIEQIVETPGLDAIMIGPADLGASLGIPGQDEHQDLRAAIQSIGEACMRRNIPWGTHAGSPAALQEATDGGATFMTLNFDGEALFNALKDSMQAARSLLGHRLSP